ncbi:MAG: peptidylprolyl isomerase [Propioniciclava sp.]
MRQRIQKTIAGAGAGLLLTGVVGCATTPITSVEPTDGQPIVSAAPGTVTCAYRSSGEPAKPVDPPAGENVPATGTEVVTMSIGGDPIEITVDREAAPCTANSFVSLAQQGYYTDTSCHRLSTEGIFILQCGDPTGTGTGGPGYVFDDELASTSSYPAGTLAMANSGPNTNGSQFFFVFEDTPLPASYTVFGQLSPADNEVIENIAYQGHDQSHPDGTGVPNAPTTMTDVASG